mmetsp:Transcript_47486/g.94418  ORF Transcript_47486/g.94418 Transcript_47486/m.94418 type:complete len:98 (+) Transcript_47486:956-1249(+)
MPGTSRGDIRIAGGGAIGETGSGLPDFARSRANPAGVAIDLRVECGEPTTATPEAVVTTGRDERCASDLLKSGGAGDPLAGRETKRRAMLLKDHSLA